MRYSLPIRVRGIFLGAFLGESLACGNEKSSQGLCDLGKMSVLGSQSLIALGRLDVDDWLNRQQQASLNFTPIKDFWGHIILATLPIVVFYHEDNQKLRENLLQILVAWKVDPMLRDAALAVGFAIAQSLTERIHRLTLIPQTISFLGQTSTSFPERLSKVHTLLTDKSLLGKKPTSPTFALKLEDEITQIFYYFLNTLEDFQLTVLQAISSPARGAITGALSGAYNSIIGIPVNWQILSSAINSSLAAERTSFSQMLELCDILLAVWSGVYNRYLNKSVLTDEKCAVLWDWNAGAIFAAPRVIRPR